VEPNNQKIQDLCLIVLLASKKNLL